MATFNPIARYNAFRARIDTRSPGLLSTEVQVASFLPPNQTKPGRSEAKATLDKPSKTFKKVGRNVGKFALSLLGLSLPVSQAKTQRKASVAGSVSQSPSSVRRAGLDLLRGVVDAASPSTSARAGSKTLRSRTQSSASAKRAQAKLSVVSEELLGFDDWPATGRVSMASGIFEPAPVVAPTLGLMALVKQDRVTSLLTAPVMFTKTAPVMFTLTNTGSVTSLSEYSPVHSAKSSVRSRTSGDSAKVWLSDASADSSNTLGSRRFSFESNETVSVQQDPFFLELVAKQASRSSQSSFTLVDASAAYTLPELKFDTGSLFDEVFSKGSKPSATLPEPMTTAKLNSDSFRIANRAYYNFV